MAAGAAFATSILAEGRFGRQKWWERASAVYDDIANQLLEQKLFTAEIMRRMYPDDTGRQGEWMPSEAKRIVAEAAAAAIDKRVAEGQLLLSKSALSLLQKCQRELRELRESSGRGDLFYQGYDMVVQSYHGSFIEQAKIDLRLRWWWWLIVSRSIRRAWWWVRRQR